MMSVDRETVNGVGVVERLDGLNYRQTVTDRAGRWRLTKTYTTDPARDVVLVDVRFESLTGEPYGLHVLLDPRARQRRPRRPRAHDRPRRSWPTTAG